MKLLTAWINPPKHTHPAHGRYGLDHPAAYNALHPEMVVCTDLNCRTYARLRRQAVTRVVVIVGLWVVIAFALEEIVRYMK